MDASGWLENVGNDCRYAARRLRQSPGFAAAAILTLALGIGANVAVFTVVQAVLLSPLPYPHHERLVRIYDDLRGSNSRDVGISAPELWDLRDRSDVFENISTIYPSDGNLTGGEKPERIELLATSANYFTMLGERPELGRVYTVNDEQPGFVEGVALSDGSGAVRSAEIRRLLESKSASMATFIPSWALCRRSSDIPAGRLPAT